MQIESSTPVDSSARNLHWILKVYRCLEVLIPLETIMITGKFSNSVTAKVSVSLGVPKELPLIGVRLSGTGDISFIPIL